MLRSLPFAGVLTILLLSTTPIRADEAIAKAAAMAFLQAIKSGNADAVIATMDVPWYTAAEGLVTDPVKLKEWMTYKLSTVRNRDKLTTQVGRVIAYGKLRDQITDAAEQKILDQILQPTDLIVMVTPTKTETGQGAILVRMREGKAKVVGVIE